MSEKMMNSLRQLAALLPEKQVFWNRPMSGMTTLKLGGCADLVLEPDSGEAVGLLLKRAQELHVPVLTVGRGSNLLVRDGGIRGCVLCTRNLRQMKTEGHQLTAGAGVPLVQLSRMAAENDLAGLAFASGIPGSVGGAVRMNAGAYGGEMSQVVSCVRGFWMDGQPFGIPREELDFSHRHSFLTEREGVVTEAVFQLQSGEKESLLAEAADYNARRRDKQPLDVPSAGSTFKRPPNGYASAMIDECGLKGLQVGGAQVSTKHAGFCVNLGGTAADFMALMNEVQDRVEARFGVRLEPEVCIVGEDPKEE